MPSPLRFLVPTAVLAGSAVLAQKGVPAWDRSMLAAINGLPSSLQYPLWAPMQAGSLGGALGAGALVAIRRDRRLGVEIAVAGTAAWIAAKAIKAAIGRQRPADEIDSIELRLGAADSGLGFPSGHAALAVTTATILARNSSPLRSFGLGALPALVGFSRVHVGAHYPLDVLGGWALGAAVADATARTFDRVSTRTTA